MKKIIYIDMDHVLCDYNKAFLQYRADNPSQPFPQSQVGFFQNLEFIDGAFEAFKLLNKYFDVWILSRPSVMNPLSYMEKALWVKNNFGLEIQKKLILCCNKSLVKGHYLIDDSIDDGQQEFKGQLIRFGTVDFPNWKTVIRYIFNIEGGHYPH